jgi:hypothetical protein
MTHFVVHVFFYKKGITKQQTKWIHFKFKIRNIFFWAKSGCQIFFDVPDFCVKYGTRTFFIQKNTVFLISVGLCYPKIMKFHEKICHIGHYEFWGRFFLNVHKTNLINTIEVEEKNKIVLTSIVGNILNFYSWKHSFILP